MAISTRPLNPPDPAQDPVTHCLYCGQALRHVMVHDYGSAVGPDGVRYATVQDGPPHPAFDRPGIAGNGYFCTYGCGYRFGLAFADLGRRLKPIE